MITLKRPFVTALRTVYDLENVLVAVHTDTGQTGLGEAAAATAVTGETIASIQTAITNFIVPSIIGKEAIYSHELTKCIQESIPNNPAAKAAVEAALCNLGHSKVLDLKKYENNLTISAGSAELMAADCLDAVDNGFSLLKIKLGKHPLTDAGTLIHIGRVLREQRPNVNISFRVDANGGWSPKEAVRIIRKWEDSDMPLSWVEQPTQRKDINGLAAVTRSVVTPIMADESIFTPQDAVRLFENRAVDWVNIKLAKAGGISQASDIAAVCRAYGIPWMIGCMLESRLGVSVAAVCAAEWGANAIDLDGPLLCGSDPFTGGATFEGPKVSFSGFPIRRKDI